MRKASVIVALLLVAVPLQLCGASESTSDVTSSGSTTTKQLPIGFPSPKPIPYPPPKPALPDSVPAWDPVGKINVRQVENSNVFAVSPSLKGSKSTGKVFLSYIYPAAYTVVPMPQESNIFVYALEKGSWKALPKPGNLGDKLGDKISSYQGKPYILYHSRSDKNKITVEGYDNKTKKWTPVGNVNANNPGPSNFAIAPNGVLHIAVVEIGSKSQGKVSMYKWDSGAKQWVLVGPAQFTAGFSNYPEIAFDSKSNPYVAFIDYANGSKVSVMAFKGGKWSLVGPAGISTGPATWLSIAVDHDTDTPFVGYGEQGTAAGRRLKQDRQAIAYIVKKFVDGQWQQIGDQGTSPRVAYGSMYLFNGTPWISYSDYTDPYYGNAIVRKYDATTDKFEAQGHPGSNVPKTPKYISQLAFTSVDSPYIALSFTGPDISENAGMTAVYNLPKQA